LIKEKSLVKFILLSVITAGIYGIYVMYTLAEDTNVVCNGDGKKTTNYIVTILLSCVTCGIYGFIWYYNLGNRLQDNGPRYGVQIKESGSTILLWMILGSFLAGVGSFVAAYFLFNNFNQLARVYNANMNVQYNAPQYQQQ